MEKNLFQQAKEMMAGLLNKSATPDNKSNREAVKKMIQSAYNEATPEEKQQLQEFEQQLRSEDELH